MAVGTGGCVRMKRLLRLALAVAARAAPVPLLLGGQSLVSGDLFALAEMARAL